MSDTVKLTFQPPQGATQSTRVPGGTSLFNAANWIGLAIDSTCGALGTCGKCRVQVTAGALGITAADRKVFSPEELAAGWRLSCRAVAEADLTCIVPALLSNPKAALMGAGRHIILDANVHKLSLHLPEPSLEDQRPDAQRLADALEAEGFAVTIPLPLLRSLSRTLRENDWQVTAVLVGQSLVALEAGDSHAGCYGLAFDIGTTTVVGMLLDLTSGAALAVQSALNEQAQHGADVIARISHTMLEAEGLASLQAQIQATLSRLIQHLCESAGIDSAHIYELMLAGNATMLHLLAGLDPAAIGVTPFVPVISRMWDCPAADLNLPLLPSAIVHFLPHLGAYVGADLSAGLLATNLLRSEQPRLLLDIGTNGEIICGSQKRTVAAAAPAGPAFEGAQIQDGMRASAGAIEAVEITRDSLRLHTIEDAAPLGICGSGLLDAVAQLRLLGLLDASGRYVSDGEAAELLAPALAERLMTAEGGLRVFVLAWEHESGHGRRVVLTQRDIRELQFAKASIATGIQIVLDELGITADDLAELYLAGSFGNYLNPRSALITGLVPALPLERITPIGNAAGEGARIALLSFRERASLPLMPSLVEYHELSGRADFNDSFIALLAFPALDSLTGCL